MHNSFTVGFFLAACFALSFNLAAQDKDKDKEGFTVVKKDGTITIYERWITYPGSEPPIKAREVKGEFFFHNTIFAGLHLIQDEKKIKDWQSHVSEFKVYPQPDTATWLEYSYHDIPWPVSDQDHFLEYKLTELIPGRKLFVTFNSKPNETLAPKRDGVTRMQLSGSWTLEQIGPNHVKVIYRILSKPIGIPKFLTDPIIRSNIMTTIEEYVALLEPQPKK
ncbi:hypothetical protein [Chryseolinea lacunae]|uniref:START domain-containing protein n=1 Tax=Chryseolinea lacunae TaxID=2801331 RepID=A0ABS1L1B7_9BACT|nr:hypothetical protein [Chryseolinea lacunae]MBL0745370.1 hypothetical protein [Chryseolinea lacunae]